VKLKETAQLFKDAFKEWNEKDPFRESAVIAYYAIFSLPGLLVLVITLAGYFFGRDAVSGHLHSQISGAMGNDAADQVQEMVKKANSSTDSVWSTGYGAAGSVILILLWVAYSSMIVFYGAEFTKAFAERYHGTIAVGKHAVKDIGRES
jgi:uncharacterized BrkB/YihY/UPF0761 family membrane protein